MSMEIHEIEFTCFLCNGSQTVIGCIVLDSVGIKLITAIGVVLEMTPYDGLTSVNELEPLIDHALLIVYPQRYVLVSHLLRKEKLIELFKNVGLYQQDLKLPLNAIGFEDYDPSKINSMHRDIHMGEHQTITDTDTASQDGTWDNQVAQKRYIQHNIREQSLLNPVQLISSIQQGRQSDIPFNSSNQYQSSLSSKKPDTPDSQLQEAITKMKPLFPDNSENELKLALIQNSYDIDKAINNLMDKGDAQSVPSDRNIL